VRDFIRWVEAHRGEAEVRPESPAPADQVSLLEQQLGMPLPSDLRLVLTRFNGGVLPSGTLLPAGLGPGTIEAAVRDFAERMGADFLDPELLLPFHHTHEGSLLAFDRSAGPVPDTWPIVDYFPDTGEFHLVHRTFDGWCALCLAEWTADDFEEPFSLDKYLRQGRRHAEVEPDVASAHATVAHALKRSGEPELALASYVEAARCIPPLPWCDWQALKLAVLLDRPKEALEAATRLSSPAPAERWAERETTPAQVADAIASIAVRAAEPAPWMRLLEILSQEAQGNERAHVNEIRRALAAGTGLPDPLPRKPSPVPAQQDEQQWWQALCDGYAEGLVRDDDLLLDPALQPIRARRPFDELLRIRRDF
jgi:hypothetical protein